MKKEQVKSGSHAEVLILDVYRRWAEASRRHDYPAMDALTLPGSDFGEITSNYKKYLDIGMQCHYELSRIRVVREEGEDQAKVTGLISLIQSTVHIETKGKFTSTCARKEATEEKDAWLLDGMDIEWY